MSNGERALTIRVLVAAAALSVTAACVADEAPAVAQTAQQAAQQAAPPAGHGAGAGQGAGHGAGPAGVPAAPSADALDPRKVIKLNPAQRAHMLEQMRGFLTASQGVISGVGAGDRELAAKAAEAAAHGGGQGGGHGGGQGGGHGGGQGGGEGLRMGQVLPPEFRQMAMATHKEFGAIAELARSDASDAAVLARLGQAMNTCASCHALYQIERTE
ncbi:MAG: hypothetical protein R3C52_06550 [Hyphomonadaceae bacterium]